MKRHKYIIAMLLTGSIWLIGCNNDDISNDSDLTGIDVPEGYALVNFPTEGMQTRAAANGQRAISYVDLLLYEQQDDGTTYKLYKNSNKFAETNEGSGSTWPLRIDPELLPVGKTFKAVFLGNVNSNLFEGKQVLDGVTVGESTFADVRIQKPEGMEFTENNMYYLDVTEPFTVEQGADNTVPVMLKRIVSRHIIAGAGIPEGVESTGDYIDRYYESLLGDGQKLGNQIFGSEEDANKPKEEKSLLWQCFFQQLMRDFIFPTAYALKEHNIWDSNTSLAQWWNENENSFWDNYKDKYPSDTDLDVLKKALKNNGDYYWYQTDGDKSRALLQLINDMFDNKNACIDKMLARVKENNIPKLENGSASGQTGSYTLALNNVAEQLKVALPSATLFPWESATSAFITLKYEPTVVDLDLNVIEYVSENSSVQPQTKKIQISGNGTDKEKTLNVLLLGTKQTDSEKVFEYTSLYKEQEGDLSLPIDFNGTSLEPNVSTTYRVMPDGEITWDGSSFVVDSQNALYFSYGKIAEILTGEKGITTISYEDLVGKNNGADGGVNTPFHFALVNAYYIMNAQAFSLTSQNGYEYGIINETDKSQFYFTMQTPDFGDGTKIGTKWSVERSVTQ